MGWADRSSTGIVEGNSWTWNGESEQDGKSIRSRNVMNFISPGLFTFKTEMSVDNGNWETVIEGQVK